MNNLKMNWSSKKRVWNKLKEFSLSLCFVLCIRKDKKKIRIRIAAILSCLENKVYAQTSSFFGKESQTSRMKGIQFILALFAYSNHVCVWRNFYVFNKHILFVCNFLLLKKENVCFVHFVSKTNYLEKGRCHISIVYKTHYTIHI